MANQKTLAALPVSKADLLLNNLLVAGLRADFFNQSAKNILSAINRCWEIKDEVVKNLHYQYFTGLNALSVRLFSLIDGGNLLFYLPEFIPLDQRGRLAIYLQIAKTLGPPQIYWSWPNEEVPSVNALEKLQNIYPVEEKNNFTAIYCFSADQDILVSFKRAKQITLAQIKLRRSKLGIEMKLHSRTERLETPITSAIVAQTIMNTTQPRHKLNLREMRELNRQLEETKKVFIKAF